MSKKAIYILPLLFAACGEDDPTMPTPMVNEEEVITTLNLTLTGGGETITASFRDLDGDGAMDPVITQPGPLTSGVSYALAVELLNESESPVEDITEEIREEAEEHLFFFPVTGGVAEVMITDQESDYGPNAVGDDLPVGLAATLTALTPGSGTLRVILEHLPPVNGTAQKVPGGALGVGETDIDVTFELTVQ